MTDGGYDSGYRDCPCFWGPQPGSLVREFLQGHPGVTGFKVLDAGCGEGKNARFLASHGATVIAVDCSALALSNARTLAPVGDIQWVEADIRALTWPDETFDIVVAYGLFHCFRSRAEISALVKRLQAATRPEGFHLVCSFNSRFQDLRAHPGFNPCLLNHEEYLRLYDNWTIVSSTDSDLVETHPHNMIEHIHSMTRLCVQNRNDKRLSTGT